MALIDCDEDGEFTERSAGIYNAVNDYSMLLLAEETGCDEYLQHVVRNLDMMFTYMEPDGSIFTMNSTRQDKELGKCFPVPYYPIYLYMAYKTGDGRYFAMLNRIMELVGKGKCDAPDCLYLFMAKPKFRNLVSKEAAIPAKFERNYKNAGIVRIGGDGFTCTLLRDNSRFLFFNTTSISCYVKMCSSFFGKAQFKAATLEKTETSYVMSQQVTGFYREPFDRFIADEDYWEMNKSRTHIKQIEFSTKITVEIVDGGLELHVVTDGCDRVPFKLEFCITPSMTVLGNGYMLKGEAGQSITATSGFVTAKSNNDEITIGPAFGSHMITSNMRGSEPPDVGCFRVS